MDCFAFGGFLVSLRNLRSFCSNEESGPGGVGRVLFVLSKGVLEYTDGVC